MLGLLGEGDVVGQGLLERLPLALHLLPAMRPAHWGGEHAHHAGDPMNAAEAKTKDMSVCIRCLAWTLGKPARCEDCKGEVVWVEPRKEREEKAS